MPIYALCPDGRKHVSTDFRRARHTRPECGYAGVADPNADVLAPDDVGLWRLDLETDQSVLIVSVAQAAAIPYPYGDIGYCLHWFNHMAVNTSGTRVAFLHRWRPPGTGGWGTRMFVVNLDGSGLAPVICNRRGHVSHFVWRDESHIMAYARIGDGEAGYHLVNAESGEAERLALENPDGHFSFMPGNRDWILNDTYPHGKGQRVQTLCVQHLHTGRKVDLGSFPYPESPQYEGQLRCDLHPRISQDGRLAVFDSAHNGGRQIYLAEVPDLN